MTILWDPAFRAEPTSARIVEDANLVDYVDDWSRVRSPSRARRRLKRGFRQNIVTRAVPQTTVYSLDNGRTIVMHPEVARAYERQLAKQMDELTEGALMTGRPLTRHRWPKDGTTFPNKTERECLNGCGIVKVTRHESEGGKPVYWTEFWRGLDRIECEGTPVCTAPARAASYDARNYPL